MKQTNFISSLIHHHYHLTTLVFFFFFFFLPKTCQSIHDQQYLDCGVPQTCGGQSISYPFYIDQHKSHCGFPDFDLSCNSNNQPIINLSNNSYIVHDIFYKNQRIRISNAEFLSNEPDSTSCFPISIRNLTLSENRFDFALNNKNLFVWLNCSSNFTSHDVVSCSDDKLEMILENDLNFGNVSRNCRNGVKVLVELDDEIGEDWEYYERLLRRGFLLKWNASDCSVCQQSGGRCGFHCATKPRVRVIWNNRNSIVFRGKDKNPIELAQHFGSYWEEIEKSQTDGIKEKDADGGKWRPPSDPFVKINTDGARFVYHHCYGVGLIARDNKGMAVGVKTERIHWRVGSDLLEASAILEGLVWARDRGYKKVEIESDSLQMISLLKAGSCDHDKGGTVLKDILSIMHNFEECVFSFARRDKNRAAHMLAQLALIQCKQDWGTSLPLCIFAICRAELSI